MTDPATRSEDRKYLSDAGWHLGRPDASRTHWADELLPHEAVVEARLLDTAVGVAAFTAWILLAALCGLTFLAAGYLYSTEWAFALTPVYVTLMILLAIGKRVRRWTLAVIAVAIAAGYVLLSAQPEVVGSGSLLDAVGTTLLVLGLYGLFMRPRTLVGRALALSGAIILLGLLIGRSSSLVGIIAANNHRDALSVPLELRTSVIALTVSLAITAAIVPRRARVGFACAALLCGHVMYLVVGMAGIVLVGFPTLVVGVGIAAAIARFEWRWEWRRVIPPEITRAGAGTAEQRALIAQYLGRPVVGDDVGARFERNGERGEHDGERAERNGARGERNGERVARDDEGLSRLAEGVN